MLTANIPAAVERIEDRTRDVRIITLAPRGPFAWRAGQYMQIGADGFGSRSYSIASPPNDQGHLVFHVRNMGGGLSAHLAQNIKTGDLLNLHGPFGTMNTGLIEKRPVLMVAGGTGIAPMLAMAEDIIKNDLTGQITLVYGARTLQDIYCRTELDRLETSGRVRLHIVTDPHTPDQHLRQLAADLREHVIYVSGPDPMMLPVHKALLELHAVSDRIFCDTDMNTLQKAAP